MSPPVPFGYRMSWLAIRSAEPDHVVMALGIEEAGPSSWQEGIDAVYASESLLDHAVFVTPALDGWVLVVSPGFFAAASDADPERLGRFVTDAARRLGTDVQFFASHRVVDGHAWAWADEEGLKRAFYYLGEVDECLVDTGAETPHEETLECVPPDADDVPDESTVMSVAGAWSLDPTELEGRFPDADAGQLGRMTVELEGGGPAEAEEARRPWWRFW